MSTVNQEGNLKGFFLNFQVIANIVTRRNPIITRSRSRVLRNSINMSIQSGSSDRSGSKASPKVKKLVVRKLVIVIIGHPKPRMCPKRTSDC